MKLFQKITAILFTALCFSILSCATIEGVDYKSAAELGTPENSVVFYGGATYSKAFKFSQKDSKFPADFLNITNSNEVFASTPVPMGSTYTMQSIFGSRSSGNMTFYWSDTMPLNYTGYDIHIPKKPGLYYVGYFDGEKSFREGKFVPAKFLIRSDADLELSALKKILKVYRQTSWEAVIQNRISEILKEHPELDQSKSE